MCPKELVKKCKPTYLLFLGFVAFLCISVILIANTKPTIDDINNPFIKQLALSTKADKIRWKILCNNEQAKIKRWIAYKVNKGFILESSTICIFSATSVVMGNKEDIKAQKSFLRTDKSIKLQLSYGWVIIGTRIDNHGRTDLEILKGVVEKQLKRRQTMMTNKISNKINKEK